MKPIPLQPNLPTPTNCFGKPVPASQWYVCPNCKKESPLTKKWVGLTDEEIEQLGDKHLVSVQEYIGSGDYVSYFEGETDFARAIEAKLRAKNGF